MGLDLVGFVRKTTKVTLGGKDFIFTELTLGDLGVIKSRVTEHKKATRAERRDRLLEDAKAIGDVDPLKLLEALDRPPSEAEYDAFAETPAGATLAIYLSLKHAHPEVTEADAAQIVGVADMSRLKDAMGLGDDEKKTAPSLKEKRLRGVLPSQSRSASTKGRSSTGTSKK